VVEKKRVEAGEKKGCHGMIWREVANTVVGRTYVNNLTVRPEFLLEQHAHFRKEQAARKNPSPCYGEKNLLRANGLIKSWKKKVPDKHKEKSSSIYALRPAAALSPNVLCRGILEEKLWGGGGLERQNRQVKGKTEEFKAKYPMGLFTSGGGMLWGRSKKWK